MNLLDENVRGDQRELLRKWRIPIRQVGKELSRTGIQDPDLIPLLHHLKRPTLFTQDKDFFQRKLCHPSYCLVLVQVSNIEVAQYIRRLLRHPKFNTQARRLGKVIHVHSAGVEYWQSGCPGLVPVNWLEL